MSQIVETLEAYRAGPALLRAAIDGLSPEELHVRPVPGKWSVHEVVCHLADFEIINAERMQRALAEDRPTVFNAEPDGYAARLAYSARDTESELTLIALLRTRMATTLEAADESAWNRVMIHSTDGEFSVRQLVERTTRHIPHHIRFIAEKRAALGLAPPA